MQIGVQHKISRKTALPRTGRELDAVAGGGGAFSSGGGSVPGGGGQEPIDINILPGAGIDIEKSGTSYTIIHGDTSEGESTANEGTFVVTNVLIDQFGHVTGFESGDLSVTLDKKYLRKDKPDWTEYLLGLLGGATFGDYVGGFLGSGGIFDKDGRIEGNSLTLREFLEVPELRFNRVDVVSGELWNAIAFGLIESVDETNKIVKLKLEEGELSGMHLNDFCRGIFHNLLDNETSPGVDSSGFDVVVGFRTGYFTPVEIIDNATFRYELKPGSTVHPCKAMKFAVYGNATDTNRQSSAYHTRTYTRYLSGVNTWQIDSSNIAVQLGDCSGLIIDGEPLAEASIYLNNVYFGGNIWFTPEFKEEIKGNDAYSVTLSTYNAVFNVADGIYEQADVVSADKNITTGANQVVASQFNVSTRIQASKGTEQLRYSTTIGAGKYLVTSTGSGCKYVITDGLIAVQEVFDDKAEIKVEVNCEGMATYEVVFTIVRVADGRDGKDYEYICTRTATEIKPAIPDTSQVDDYVPDGWTDDSVGPTLALPYEWISKRTKRDGVWGNYSSPSLFSRYGEDGTDIEYIYTRTIANTAPAKPKTSQNNDYIPDGWTDDPAGPTRELPHEWISSRKKDKEVWSEFSAPALWCRFAEDGKDHEFIYSRTTTNSRPGTPETSQADDHVPYGWTDDAIGVNSTYVYEWRSERTKAKGVWGNFSAPALFARYSFDGNNGNNGTDGTSEYTVYRRSDSQPNTPSGNTIPPYGGWALDPPAGSSPLWSSKAIFYSSGYLYRNWSTPVKITGDTGAAGIGSIGPAITNRGKYSSSKQYYGGTDRVDVVLEGSYYYMAKTTAGTFSGQYPNADNAYWKRLQGQYESIATGLAIIGEANIAGWRFREGYIESQNNNVVLDGNADSGPRIALGASYANRHTAPTRMYDDGSIVTKKLTADDGCKIGAFNISNGWLTSSAGAYMDLSYGLTHIKMGPNLVPAVGGGYTGVMSVKNGVNNYGNAAAGLFNSNTALECTAQGSDINYVIKGKYFDSGNCGILFRHYGGDASWLYRPTIHMDRMPQENHINSINNTGAKYKVGWDSATGYFYIY